MMLYSINQCELKIACCKHSNKVDGETWEHGAVQDEHLPT